MIPQRICWYSWMYSECFFLYKCILYFSPFNTDAQRNLRRKLIDWILHWSFLTFKTTQHLKRLLSLNFCVNYEWNLIKYQSTTWVLMDKLICSPFSLWANAIMTSQSNHHKGYDQSKNISIYTIMVYGMDHRFVYFLKIFFAIQR